MYESTLRIVNDILGVLEKYENGGRTVEDVQRDVESFMSAIDDPNALDLIADLDFFVNRLELFLFTYSVKKREKSSKEIIEKLRDKLIKVR